MAPEEAHEEEGVDIIDQRRKQRQGVPGSGHAERVERVREYEKNETANSPTARDGMDRLTVLDPQTELYNYRAFLKEFKAELSRAKRYKQPCSICLLTIDNFEDVLQQYGYLTGEAVLRVIANVLRTTLRESDIPAKYESQVFAIVFPQTGSADAALAAERIRKRIGNQAITHNWQSFSVTASVGIASFPAHGQNYDQLLAKAIEGLEYALERGGDRVLSA